MKKQTFLSLFIFVAIYCGVPLSGQDTPQADWPAWKKGLGELLAERSRSRELPEVMEMSPANWSYVSSVADTLRGRCLFIKADPPLDSKVGKEILLRCGELARKILELEASGPQLQASTSLSNKNQRGWGIEKPYNLRGVIGVNTVDLWTTSSCLVALTEFLPLVRLSDPALFQEVLKVTKEVLDYWITHYSAESPLGGRYFFKIGTDHPDIRQFLIFNTESLMAIALLEISKIARLENDNANAEKYFQGAIAHGRQVKKGIVDPLRAGGGVNVSNWMYMTTGVPGVDVKSRPEDVGHGGLDPDVIHRFLVHGVREGGEPMFVKEDLAIFGKILSDHVFIRDAKGRPAYRIWHRPVSGISKQVYEEFLTEDPGSPDWIVSTSWKYAMTEKKPRAEIGKGLRTAWGWIYGASHDPKILEQVYRYYAAYLNTDRISLQTVKPEDVTKGGKGLYISLAALYSVLP